MELIQNCPGCFQTLDGRVFFIRNGLFRLSEREYHFDVEKAWASSIALNIIIMENSELFRNKTVLELGAGMGSCSEHVRKHTQASSVVTTDMAEIDWFDLDPEDTRKFDVIIAADCMYRTTHTGFLETIEKYLAPTGRAIIVNPKREALDDALYAIKSKWENACIQTQMLKINADYQIELVFIFI